MLFIMSELYLVNVHVALVSHNVNLKKILYSLFNRDLNENDFNSSILVLEYFLHTSVSLLFVNSSNITCSKFSNIHLTSLCTLGNFVKLLCYIYVVMFSFCCYIIKHTYTKCMQAHHVCYCINIYLIT